MKPKTTAPPEHLSKDAATWWSAVVAAYVLEDHHLRLLTEAAVSWDRAQEARRIIERDGIVVIDRFGQPREHPAVKVETASRTLYARLMRELDLDGEPLPDPRLPRRGR